MEELLNKKQAAARLTLSVPTIDRLMKAKKLNCRKLGNSVRFTEGDLQRYIEQKGAADGDSRTVKKGGDMETMPKSWYEGRIASLSGQLEKAKERLAADKRALEEAKAFYAESYGLAEELTAVIGGLRRKLAAPDKPEGGEL